MYISFRGILARVLSRVKKLAEEYKQPSSSFREHRWGSTTGLADIDIDIDTELDVDGDVVATVDVNENEDTDEGGKSSSAGSKLDEKRSQGVCDCVVHRNALSTSGRRAPLSMRREAGLY
jgi:hypothetical protein